MSATLTPTEDQIFDAMWALVASYFDPSVQGAIFKGFQNQTATPTGSYVVIQPGIYVRQNQLTRGYDSVAGLQNIERSTTYSYQVDCYGPMGPDYCNIIAIGFASLWSCDNNASPSILTPLYADDPTQLNIVNGELQSEQRFMTRLFCQVNHVVGLPQQFFDTAPTIISVVADDL